MNQEEEKTVEREVRKRGRPTKVEQLGRQRTNSTGSISEILKRKREREEEQERIRAETELTEKFLKTRKIGRSPPQGKEEKESSGSAEDRKEIGETEMEKLMEIMMTVRKDVEDIKKGNTTINKEIRELREEWKKEREKWEQDKKELEERIRKMEEKIGRVGEESKRLEEIERKEEARERRERRNNIIIRGEDMITGETPKEAVKQTLKQHLQIEADVEEAYWTGKGGKGTRLVAKLKDWQNKKEIMREKNRLKDKKLYIDNDLTKKEREVQKEIAAVARAERERGAITKIGYRKLKINEKIFRWKEEGGFEEAKFWSRRNSADP